MQDIRRHCLLQIRLNLQGVQRVHRLGPLGALGRFVVEAFRREWWWCYWRGDCLGGGGCGGEEGRQGGDLGFGELLDSAVVMYLQSGEDARCDAVADSEEALQGDLA